jgi:hypothetical protein
VENCCGPDHELVDNCFRTGFHLECAGGKVCCPFTARDEAPTHVGDEGNEDIEGNEGHEGNGGDSGNKGSKKKTGLRRTLQDTEEAVNQQGNKEG